MKRPPSLGATSPDPAPSETPPSARGRTLASWLIALLVSVGLGVYAWQTRDQFGFLAHPRWEWVAPLVAMTLLTQLLGALLFGVALRHAGCQAGALPVLHLYVLGRLLNFIVPQSGNLYRAAVLKRAHGFDPADYWRVFVAIGWLEAGVVLLICALIGWLLPQIGRDVALILTLLSLGWALIPNVAQLALGGLSGRVRIGWRRRLSKIALGWTELVRAPRMLLLLAVLSGLTFTGHGARSFCALAFLSAEAPAVGAIVYALVNKVSTLALLTPGNVGLQEAAFVGVTAALDDAVGPQALAAAVVLRGVLYAVLLALVALSSARMWKAAR
mgnify:FL=1